MECDHTLASLLGYLIEVLTLLVSG